MANSKQVLTINTARSNPNTALVAGITQPYTPVAFRHLKYGEFLLIPLYLIDGDSYDERSGGDFIGMQVLVELDDKTPKQGTFTISDGSDTTSALDWDATASEVETALNELNTDTGPFGDTVSVSKYANGSFYVKFDSAGAQASLTVNVSGIEPISSASILEIVPGDVSSRNQQVLQIKADPLVDTTDYVNIPTPNGWIPSFDCKGPEFAQAVLAGEISANYKVKITDIDGTVDVVATGPVILKP